MKYHAGNEDGQTVYFLSGTLTHADTPDFGPVFEECAHGSGRTLIADLGAVEDMDSFGIGLLLVAWNDARRIHNRLILRNAKPRIHRLLELAGLSESLLAESSARGIPQPEVASKSLVLSLSSREGAIVAHMSGRFTYADHARFRPLVEAVSHGGRCRLEIDVRGLDFMDSAALGMLLVIRDEIRSQQGSMTMYGAGERVRRLLEITGLTEMMGLSDG